MIADIIMDICALFITRNNAAPALYIAKKGKEIAMIAK